MIARKVGKAGAKQDNKKPDLPADMVSVEASAIPKIRDLHGKSSEPIVEALLLLERNNLLAIEKSTTTLEKKVNHLGTEVVAAKKAAGEATAAAESSNRSAIEARELVSTASKTVENIPSALNEAVVAQLSAEVPVLIEEGPKKGDTEMKKLTAGNLIRYILENMGLLEKNLSDVQMKVGEAPAGSQGPSLEEITTAVAEKLSATQQAAAKIKEETITTVNKIIADFRAELEARDKRLETVLDACQKAMGMDLENAEYLGLAAQGEVTALQTATPAVLAALGHNKDYDVEVEKLYATFGRVRVHAILLQLNDPAVLKEIVKSQTMNELGITDAAQYASNEHRQAREEAENWAAVLSQRVDAILNANPADETIGSTITGAA